VIDDLLEARATLCDLLIGRSLRLRAEQVLREALACERYISSDAALIHLDNAAHMEWIAVRAEQGFIRWGGRLNRCGYWPRTDDEP